MKKENSLIISSDHNGLKLKKKIQKIFSKIFLKKVAEKTDIFMFDVDP